MRLKVGRMVGTENWTSCSGGLGHTRLKGPVFGASTNTGTVFSTAMTDSIEGTYPGRQPEGLLLSRNTLELLYIIILVVSRSMNSHYYYFL